MKLPEHIAIIMDGNGRWAKKHGKKRFLGHREGMKRVKDVVELAAEKAIHYLTLFAFSTENWLRPKEEVKFLMTLLDEFIKREVNKLKENNIKLRFLGSFEKISEKHLKLIKEAEKKTSDCTGLNLNIALSYGGRQEILDAVKAIIADLNKKIITEDEITDKLFSQYLYTKDIPDPDLLIRTSGEKRISNFLLWQIAYTELYITDTLWPDFNKSEFEKAIIDYTKRERRFGKVNGS
jgi:undecaprenyl diphosphate synthase